MIPNGPGACPPARSLPPLALALPGSCPRRPSTFSQVLRSPVLNRPGLDPLSSAAADYHKPTVCTEFDVTPLADHLTGPVTFLGAAAGSGAGAAPGPGPLEDALDAGLLDRLVAFTGRAL
jgi:hypothetical protein